MSISVPVGVQSWRSVAIRRGSERGSRAWIFAFPRSPADSTTLHTLGPTWPREAWRRLVVDRRQSHNQRDEMNMKMSNASKVDNGVNVEALLARPRGAHRGTGGGPVQVARHLQLGERHAQPLDRPRSFSAWAPSSRTRPSSASTPTIRRSSRPKTTARRRWSTCWSGLASCLTAGIAAVAQNRNIQLRSVQATLEAGMDLQGILGIDSDVRNGFDGIKVRLRDRRRRDRAKTSRRWWRSRRSARRCSTSSPTRPTSPSRCV